MTDARGSMDERAGMPDLDHRPSPLETGQHPRACQSVDRAIDGEANVHESVAMNHLRVAVVPAVPVTFHHHRSLEKVRAPAADLLYFCTVTIPWATRSDRARRRTRRG